MNYKNVGCFLVILFCLLGNLGTIASSRLITCAADQENQRYVCLDDAVAAVKPHLGENMYVVGYGSAKRIPCTGRKIAASFRRQLIDAIKGGNIYVDDALIGVIDGGYRDDAWIEIHASSSGEQPTVSAQWPPNCR